MRSFLLASLASLSAVRVHSHPAHSSRGLTQRAIDLDAFRPKALSSYKNATQVVADPNIHSIGRRADPEQVAHDLVAQSVPGATFRLRNDNYVGTNGISHFYYVQTLNGIDLEGSSFNVNIGKDGAVFSFGNSFYTGKPPPPPAVKRDDAAAANALRAAVKVLSLPISADSATAVPKQGTDAFTIKQTSGAVKEPEARLVYTRDASNNPKLAWRVETDILSNWLLTYVDAEDSNKVYSVIDYSADATYEVYPWGINDPTEGERKVITDPFDRVSSEFSWNSDGTTKFNTTRGNNGVAHTNWENKKSDFLSLPRPASKDLKFEYPFSLSESDYHVYANASITQLFYTANMYHDLLYTLGFNEKAGNFEINNNGGGGVGRDFVYLDAQDGSGTNNANFATPPDGEPGRMRMYIWDGTSPVRDCSFDAGVVIHEYTHGLSNRLTGGPANSGCLSALESGGMGEGWSDFFATAIRLKPKDTRKTDYGIGTWITNKEGGIRNFPYSTSMTTNPQVYSSTNQYNRVHPIGAVWASMLYEVLWNLIDKHGKNDAAKPTFDAGGVPTDGRYLAMKLVMDGMALQPCNPNFVSARDAILDADKALTGGKNACAIWTGFAKRGLGEGAKFESGANTDSSVIPKGVC